MKTCRAHPWSKFFWADWESDEGLRQCSLAAQGLWMRMLCICAKSDRHGYLLINGTHLDVPGLATAVSRPATEVAPLLDELDRWGVFSRNSKGQILSRRMVRDAKKSADGKKAKIEGIKNGMKKSPEISRKSEKLDMTERIENKDVSGLPSRVPIRGASTQKPEARKKVAQRKLRLPLAPGRLKNRNSTKSRRPVARRLANPRLPISWLARWFSPCENTRFRLSF